MYPDNEFRDDSFKEPDYNRWYILPKPLVMCKILDNGTLMLSNDEQYSNQSKIFIENCFTSALFLNKDSSTWVTLAHFKNDPYVYYKSPFYDTSEQSGENIMVYLVRGKFVGTEYRFYDMTDHEFINEDEEHTEHKFRQNDTANVFYMDGDVLYMYNENNQPVRQDGDVYNIRQLFNNDSAPKRRQRKSGV